MSRTVLLAISLWVCWSMLLQCVIAADTFVQFVGENGAPLSGARFYFYEEKDRRFVRALSRGEPLGHDSTANIREIPQEYRIGVHDKSEHYYKFWSSSELVLKPGKNLVRVPISGRFLFSFSHVDPFFTHDSNGIPKPYVMEYSRKRGSEYSFVGSIGIFLATDTPHDIPGIEPGDYKFELKNDYATPDVLWRAENVVIDKGRTTAIHRIVLATVR